MVERSRKETVGLTGKEKGLKNEFKTFYTLIYVDDCFGGERDTVYSALLIYILPAQSFKS
jgi:hypothetical protein